MCGQRYGPRRNDHAVWALAVVAMLVMSAAHAATSGPLRVHGTNARYLADATGRVVYLTGSHTWDDFMDDGPTDPPAPIDYTAFLDFLQARGHNFFRLWRAENAKGGEGAYVSNYWFSPLPYPRLGPGTALDGKPKFDVTQFDQAYFDRLRSRVQAAAQRGIYVSIMLFDGWSIESKGGNHNPWPGHPFNAANNVNGVDGDANHNGNGEELQTLALPAITALEDAYVRKVIDTVNDLDNVLYEISNEAPGNSEAWQAHMISLVKSYEAGKAQQHPVGMTVEYPGGSNADLFASAADWISPSGDPTNPMVGDGRKVVLYDTDHLCGICGDRTWVWKSVTRGLNPIFMDPYSAGVTTRGAQTNYDPTNANDVGLRRNLGWARQYAERMDLAAATPRGDLASTGYALANPAQGEYLVYLPGGGAVDVDLTGTPGTVAVEWFNPATGQVTSGAAGTGGTSRAFAAPFGGDAVLYLQRPVPASTTTTAPGSTVTTSTASSTTSTAATGPSTTILATSTSSSTNSSHTTTAVTTSSATMATTSTSTTNAPTTSTHRSLTTTTTGSGSRSTVTTSTLLESCDPCVPATCAIDRCEKPRRHRLAEQLARRICHAQEKGRFVKPRWLRRLSTVLERCGVSPIPTSVTR